MGIDLLSVGQSALTAAQVGISTTGNNIANASTPGYNRQTVLQTEGPTQNMGYGFVGKGTEVTTVQRNYSQFLTTQANSIQSTQSQINTFYTQISQVNNLIGTSSTGVSPSLQSFFSAVQNLAANPSTAAGSASRQATLSAAQALTQSFQSMQNSLSQVQAGVNTQISGTVQSINNYATQLAQLNTAIQQADNTSNGSQPNDLLDQRDLVINSLSQLTQVSVVPQGDQYNVFIGNGQPLVVGASVSTLAAVNSQSNPGNLEVAYTSNGKTQIVNESNLPGGQLGGLFSFRSTSLNVAQNSLGLVAVGVANTVNAQQNLGMDLNGNMGANLFSIPSPTVTANTLNTGSGQVTAAFAPATGPNTGTAALTTSDYSMQFDGTNYKITRLSDGTSVSTNAAGTPPVTLPLTFDGVVFNLGSGTPSAGDSYLIQPTANAAAGISVAITNPSQIAAAAPITTSVPSTNTGSGKISSGSVSSGFALANIATPLQLTYSSAGNSISGFPNGATVNVTNNGVVTPYTISAASPSVPYTAGASISYAGMNFSISGTPANGDTFQVAQNTSGVGDNRNALLMANLQTASTLLGGTSNYQGLYAQMVSKVGNDTQTAKSNNATQTQLLTNATQAVQSYSGVNLDEEATNLLQYQQAYQAAGKYMQIASQLFTQILSIGG